VFAQSAKTPDVITRHQVGFNASEALRVFERPRGDHYKINYQYKFNQKSSFRAGVNYSLDTSGAGSIKIGVKTGWQKIFKDYGAWKFYYGADAISEFEKFSSSSRRNYEMGAGPLFGVIFYMNDHFSISTDTNLFFRLKHYNDPDSFNPDNSETWIAMDIANIGQLVLSVHF
jgi:hypothetical protein